MILKKKIGLLIIPVFSALFLANTSFALNIKQVKFSALPGFDLHNKYINNKLELTGALAGLKSSCNDTVIRFRNNKNNSSGLDKIRYSLANIRVCKKVLALSNSISESDFRDFLVQNYNPYLVLDKNHNSVGTFTGYYQPVILGSLTKSKKFPVPIYGKPDNLERIDLGVIDAKLSGKKSYRLNNAGRYTRLPSREVISKTNILKGSPILAWVKSKVDRFFLQIQGSGTIAFVIDVKNKTKNKITHNSRLLGYAAQNGHKYYPIGKYLVESGKIPRSNISMQSIKRWLKAHPGQQQTVMNMDPSFVFFKRLKQQYPNGAQGLPLTPRHSIAVDKEYIPLGSLLWVSTYLPKLKKTSVHKKNKIVRGDDFNQLMVAQDTGGAIKGAVRGDVFWGLGEQEEFLAGHMNSQGKYYILLAK